MYIKSLKDIALMDPFYHFTFQRGVVEAKNFTGNRQYLLELHLKHITAKPRRIFETATSQLHNPWDSSEPMEQDENSELSKNPKSDKSSDVTDFNFIEHLRRTQERRNRKRPGTLSISESEQTRKILSDSDSKTDPDSKSSRNAKVPKLDESLLKPEKKKTQKITWP
jgi:hypothetical protein